MERIGHFAFFHDRFRDSLWPIPLAWLTERALPKAHRAGATRANVTIV
ncbi:hypothetical protein [Halomonas kalidii]|uniref:Uncharacterized protein n=1 Tax=Halomonas kalidii TaxID=3043293 RepID=A0ABT6VH94_9GAMM|nr:hypothetical protein [Halomonas kalidii]MDI5933353.1 hypothetical protein [Halomonas kalidii]